MGDGARQGFALWLRCHASSISTPRLHIHHSSSSSPHASIHTQLPSQGAMCRLEYHSGKSFPSMLTLFYIRRILLRLFNQVQSSLISWRYHDSSLGCYYSPKSAVAWCLYLRVTPVFLFSPVLASPSMFPRNQNSSSCVHDALEIRAFLLLMVGSSRLPLARPIKLMFTTGHFLPGLAHSNSSANMALVMWMPTDVVLRLKLCLFRC